jgi:glycosyltransferase involved in cell wall biosynthesis
MYQSRNKIAKDITVAMTTFNGGNYLIEQLDSILSQTLLPTEFIVCDDGSTDNTIAILKEYEQKGLIQLYLNKTKLGVICNFKKAVSLAKPYNYIALADQDDIWLPNKLKTLQEKLYALEQNKQELPCAVYSDLILIDKHKKVLNKSFWNELNHDVHEHCFQTLLFGNFVTGCSMMFNDAMKQQLLRLPYDNILHDVWMAFIGNTIGNISGHAEPLVLYRQHEKNVTYQEGNRKISKWGLRRKRFNRIFLKNDYLENEYKTAARFLEFYENELSSIHKRQGRCFLFTKKLPYLFKEIVLKIFFWGKWK